MLHRSYALCSAASRKTVARKMSEGSVTGGDVPVPSFVLHILQRNPSIRELRLDDRMQLLLGEWKKLTPEGRHQFVAAPLKGLV
jgi:hypothetical protein